MSCCNWFCFAVQGAVLAVCTSNSFTSLPNLAQSPYILLSISRWQCVSWEETSITSKTKLKSKRNNKNTTKQTKTNQHKQTNKTKQNHYKNTTKNKKNTHKKKHKLHKKQTKSTSPKALILLRPWQARHGLAAGAVVVADAHGGSHQVHELA